MARFNETNLGPTRFDSLLDSDVNLDRALSPNLGGLGDFRMMNLDAYGQSPSFTGSIFKSGLGQSGIFPKFDLGSLGGGGFADILSPSFGIDPGGVGAMGEGVGNVGGISDIGGALGYLGPALSGLNFALNPSVGSGIGLAGSLAGAALGFPALGLFASGIGSLLGPKKQFPPMGEAYIDYDAAKGFVPGSMWNEKGDMGLGPIRDLIIQRANTKLGSNRPATGPLAMGIGRWGNDITLSDWAGEGDIKNRRNYIGYETGGDLQNMIMEKVISDAIERMTGPKPNVSKEGLLGMWRQRSPAATNFASGQYGFDPATDDNPFAHDRSIYLGGE